MAVQVFSDATFVINSVDLSDHVDSVKLEAKADALERTAMGMTEHQFAQGLQDWSVEVTIFQDYAAGSVDPTLFALLTAGAVPFTMKPDSGDISTSNPEYQGNVVFEGYEPITGGVGTLPKVSAKFKPASALVRDVTP